MAIVHAFSDTVANITGTATVWNGATTSTIAATDLVRPQDWNSAHNMAFTLTGNTTLNSTLSGTNIVLAGSGGVQVGGSNGSFIISNAPINSFVPWYPGSTSTQTIGAMGTSTASAIVFPVIVDAMLAFNHIKFGFSASVVTSAVSGQQTITSGFGIFSNNAGTLSLISSNSFSIAITGSGVSATVSFPTSTGTGGYGYGTTTWTTTAQAQSLFGTAGQRIVDLVFTGNMSLAPGAYYIGLHQRQSTSSGAIGLSTAFIGNAQGEVTGIGYLGRSTADFTSRSDVHMNLGWHTSTGSAGYSGTTLPSSIIMSGVVHSGAVLPFITFAST